MRTGPASCRALSRQDVLGAGKEIGQIGSYPAIASRKSAQSSTSRAMGPSTPPLVKPRWAELPPAMPGEGRRPTMPPKSAPWLSHSSPVASDTAAPPEDPAAFIAVFQGLRVAPNTALKVLAPAPIS